MPPETFLFVENNVLSDRQIRKLKEHKYSSEGSSILEPLLQRWWCWAVQHVPLYISPNMLTLLGLLANIVSFIPLAVSCPTFTEQPPRLGLLLFAVCFFLYQTLDALDGKHARRIGMSSPMGELFDHGCDALNTVIVVLAYNISLQLGMEPSVNLYSFCNAVFMFYLAHWHTYCTGTLSFGKMDVTEAQLLLMGQFALTAAAGPTFWDTVVFGLSMRVAMIMLSTAACIPAIISHLHVILFEGGVGRGGTTVAETSVLSPAKNIGFAMVFMWLIQGNSPDQLAQNHTLLFYCSFGCLFCKITCNLIIGHMCRSELNFLDSGMVGLGAVFLNQYLSCPVPEVYALGFSLAWGVGDLLLYILRVLCVISHELAIPILLVPPEKQRLLLLDTKLPAASQPPRPRKRTRGQGDIAAHSSSGTAAAAASDRRL